MVIFNSYFDITRGYIPFVKKTRNRSKILRCVNVGPSHKPTNVRSRYLPCFFQQLSYWLVNQLSEWVFAPYFWWSNHCWFVISCYIPVFWSYFAYVTPQPLVEFVVKFLWYRTYPDPVLPQESLVSIQLLESPRNQWRFSIAASTKISYPPDVLVMKSQSHSFLDDGNNKNPET